MEGPVLSHQRFNSVKKWCIERLQRGRDPVTKEWINVADAVELDLPMDTLRQASIFMFVYLRLVAETTHSFRQQLQQEGLPQCVLDRSKTMFEYAEERCFSPYKFAKLYLGEVLKQKVDVSKFLTQGHTVIAEQWLKEDLIHCFTEDFLHCASTETAKAIAGEEHEQLLIEKLESIHACFITEHEMRQRGEAKTPDVLLLIPMGVKIRDQLHIVNWIDSKALFADEYEHEKYVSEQLKGYVSRFGSGLVIYWQGCSERVFTSADDGSGVVAVASFPKDWYFPTGEAALAEHAPQFDSYLPMLDVEQQQQRQEQEEHVSPAEAMTNSMIPNDDNLA